MIAKLVSFALRQPFVIVVAALALMVWGAWSFQNLPIDAYPDLSPPHVELITQWPGHAPEEIERLITIPIEIELNGIPRLDSLRSISRYGLSFIAMNFEYGTDPYFVREQAFERMGQRPVARRPDAQSLALVQPQRVDLPVRDPKPRPLAAGAEDHRGLGAGTPLSLHTRGGGRFRAGRHHHAVPGVAGPPQAVRLRCYRAADFAAARQQ